MQRVSRHNLLKEPLKHRNESSNIMQYQQKDFDMITEKQRLYMIMHTTRNMVVIAIAEKVEN